MNKLTPVLAENSQNLFAIQFPEYINQYVLTANTAKAVTVPAGAKIAMFSADDDFMVVLGAGPAVWPVGDVTDGTGGELNPGLRGIQNVTQMSIISDVACVVQIAFFN